MRKPYCVKRFICIICTLIVILVCFSGCGENYQYKVSYAMGSVVSATICTEDEELSDNIFNSVVTAISETEDALSNTKKSSEVYKLNNNKIIYASDYFKEILSNSILLCNMMERRIDISIGKVTKLWGFNTDTPSLPSDEALKEVAQAIGVEKILINDEDNKVTISNDIELDLGAFGKGAACDAAFDAVRYDDIPIIMSIGGTVFAYGENPSGKDWSVGIRDPYSDTNSYFAVLNLEPRYPKKAVFISTSGSYEKTFTENGTTYHHILDPETGYPVESDLVSVTVVANSGLNADALSTFFFINGLNEDTLSYMDSFSCDAVFVFKDKTYYVTEGLKDSLNNVSSDYSPADITFDNEE